MSVLSNINETSSKVKEVDRLVKVAKFEDETKLKASLVFNGEVRLRASYEDGGSVLCVVVSSASPDNAEVVFQRKMNEAEFKQHACISENNIQFRSAVSTIYGLIKHSMDENSSVRMELKVRQKKNGNSVAIFDFKFKMTSGSLFMGYATSLTFELEELKGDLLCKYLAQRLLKLEKTNERRDTKYLELKQKYFDSKNECERLNDLLDQTQREASKLRQQEGAIMEMKDQLESQYYHRNEDLGRLQEELDDKLVEYQELQNDYEKLQSNFEILLDGYNDQKAEIEVFEWRRSSKVVWFVYKLLIDIYKTLLENLLREDKWTTEYQNTEYFSTALLKFNSCFFETSIAILDSHCCTKRSTTT
ncbi:hypothetical protein M3Y98_00910400 [Aphelenchoides besseyi]|nr:hypothetical protein M3Y98_00910400 [Aphelenchoides besseyi]